MRTTLLYWSLLLYVVAALIWWFISLEKQNHLLAEKDLATLQGKKTYITATDYQEQLRQIERRRTKNTTKYISEGITFLVLIGISAVWVYRSVRRRIRLQEQQEAFMMAVTHELKTPIAVAKLNLETLQRYSLDEEKQKRLVKTTLEENARLNFLTNNILVASQLAGKRFHFDPVELDLSELLRDCVRDFQKRYPDRLIQPSIAKETILAGDPLLLQILVNNLLENAHKYSPADKPIELRLTEENGQCRLEVIDQGPGIPPGEQKRIFDRFYRIESEVTRKTQGTGLGLYLCKKIAQAHRASISVSPHPPQGSNFAVAFRS